MIPAHRSRVSAWWLLGPGLLFGFSFLAAVLTTATTDKNLVYNLPAILVTAVVDVVLACNVVFAVRISRLPSPDAGAAANAAAAGGRTGARHWLLDRAGQAGVEPILHASKKQGIAPDHTPATPTNGSIAGGGVWRWRDRPVGEELMFRGLALDHGPLRRARHSAFCAIRPTSCRASASCSWRAW